MNLRTLLTNNLIWTEIAIHQVGQSASFSGIIKAASLPWFIQTGTFDEIRDDEYYLVIYLQKLDVFS